jgi:hypothetical protein
LLTHDDARFSVGKLSRFPVRASTPNITVETFFDVYQSLANGTFCSEKLGWPTRSRHIEQPAVDLSQHLLRLVNLLSAQLSALKIPVKKHTLLICTIPAMRPVLINALSVRFNLAFCYTLREAVSLLDTGVDAVVCGIYFADGEVFDLLRLVKANPKTKHIPFFTAYGSPGELMTGVE